MAMQILHTDDYAEWVSGLKTLHQEATDTAVGKLEAKGVSLSFPDSSSIKGTTLAIRELRIKSGGAALRIFYAFDPSRDAVLLIGGAKGDKKFYKKMIPKAERLWLQYLKAYAEEHDDD